jgi:hypothetical protein
MWNEGEIIISGKESKKFGERPIGVSLRPLRITPGTLNPKIRCEKPKSNRPSYKNVLKYWSMRTTPVSTTIAC